MIASGSPAAELRPGWAFAKNISYFIFHHFILLHFEKYVTFFRNSKNQSTLSCAFFVLVFSYLDPDLVFLNEDFRSSRHRKKFEKLNRSIAKVIQDYSLVKFHPLDISDEDSIKDIVLIIDNMIQYGKDLGIKAFSNIWGSTFFGGLIK